MSGAGAPTLTVDGTGLKVVVIAASWHTVVMDGLLAGAQRASNTAKTWCWVTTGLCVIGLLWTVYSLTLGGGMAQWQMMMEQIQAGG